MMQIPTSVLITEMNRAVFDTVPPDAPYVVQTTDRGLVAAGDNSAMTVTWDGVSGTDLAVAEFRTAKTGVVFSVSFDPDSDEKGSVARMCCDAFKRL